MRAPRLDAALARGTLACVVVESIAGEVVHAIVLPWPQVDRHGCLVFHDSGPTRRLEVRVEQLGAAPGVGSLYAAELATTDAEAGALSASFAWPPLDVTAHAHAFVRSGLRGGAGG
ncbi:MAG: hypothetical protein JSS99_09780 [Actinobacteria bacterium]|nr:hypothetical protein [Actinomycetota bacterium]